MPRPPHKLFACVNDDGTAMYETVLTEEEFNDPASRDHAERRALAAGDCSRIEWKDVTDNEAFWENDTDPTGTEHASC